MKENFDLPTDAVEHMAREFESIKPVITEDELREICAGDSDLEKLLDAFLNYAVRYANDVWEMEHFVTSGGLADKAGADKFAEMDDARTRLHNALVDSVGILSRNLAKAGRDNSWVRELTNGQKLERVLCGKLALLLVYRRYIDNVD